MSTRRACTLDDKAATMAAKLEPWRALMNEVVEHEEETKPVAGAGAVILHARDAKVHGTKLRYEKPPHKDTLGFWVQKDDWAEWTFDVPQRRHVRSRGVASVRQRQRRRGGRICRRRDQTLTMKVEETGHFQRFIPRTIGTVTFDAGGPTTS